MTSKTFISILRPKPKTLQVGCVSVLGLGSITQKSFFSVRKGPKKCWCVFIRLLFQAAALGQNASEVLAETLKAECNKELIIVLGDA